MNQRSRKYTFTDYELLNWTTIFENSERMRYVCFGRETCPTTGRVHLQGWIYFKSMMRKCHVIDMISPTIHVEACKGTPAQNDAYCKKEGEVTQLGERPRQGTRSDIHETMEDIEAGATLREVRKQHKTVFMKYPIRVQMAIESVAEENAEGKWRDIHVEYYYGETGTGKTRKAFTENPGAYLINGADMKWWGGYRGQTTLIIDEYNNNVSCDRLLNLLNGIPCRLDIKGSHAWAAWTTVYITSNLTPDELHPQAKPAHRNALFRRINVKRKFLPSLMAPTPKPTQTDENPWIFQDDEMSTADHKSDRSEVAGNTEPQLPGPKGPSEQPSSCGSVNLPKKIGYEPVILDK